MIKRESFNLYLSGFWFNEYTGFESELMIDALVFFGTWGNNQPEWICEEMITYQKVNL